MTPNLIRPINIRIFPRLPAPLRLAIKKYRSACFRVGEEMDGLHEDAENELYPEDPGEREEFFYEPADDGADDGAADGGQNEECHRVFLVVGLPHISQHAQSHGAAGCAEAREGAAYDVGSVIFGQGARNLPQIHQPQTKLLYGPASILLTPRRPKLATKPISNEERHLRYPGYLLADVEFFVDLADAVGVHACV